MHSATTNFPIQPSAILVWSDKLLLGYDPMDGLHQEFVACLGELQLCGDAQLEMALDAMLAHLENHFSEEDGWMVETDFPPRDCHHDEHAAVLKSGYEVRDLLVKGDPRPCRRFAIALQEWFPGHATHLDSALAHWMVQRQYGGKPVVLRRNV